MLLAAHGFGQLSARLDLTRELERSGKAGLAWGVVHRFQDAKVDVVFTSEDELATQYSFFAQEKPLFLTIHETGDELPNADERIFAATRAGLLSTQPEVPAQISLRGREWRFSPAGKLGNLYLFVGGPDDVTMR